MSWRSGEDRISRYLSMVLNATKGSKIVKTKGKLVSDMTIMQSLLNYKRSSSESDGSRREHTRGQGVRKREGNGNRQF